MFDCLGPKDTTFLHTRQQLFDIFFIAICRVKKEAR